MGPAATPGLPPPAPRRRPAGLRIRPITPEDAPALQDLVAGVSAETRRLRFHGGLGGLSDKMARELATVDHRDREALVAEVWRWFRWRLIAVARYARTSPAEAETAIMVADSWQRRGVGSILLAALVERARAAGLNVLCGEVLAENVAVPRLLERVLGPPSVERTGFVLSTRNHI